MATALLCLCSAQRVGGQAASTLTQLLADFNRELVDFEPQLETAKRIVAVSDQDVLPELEKWLDHEDRHFRANVAFIFAALGDDRGFEALYHIIEDHSDRALGQGIAPMRTLQNTDPEGWWMEEQVLADRHYAVRLLGVLRDPRAVEVLLPLMVDDELGGVVRWALVEIPHVWDTRLRVVNIGSKDIEDLRIGFPEGGIDFGDVPAGSTSEYREAPQGVYSYAALQFRVDGRQVAQPVIDWVGEFPLPGKSFTYQLQLVQSAYPSRPHMVGLTGVTVDE